MSADVTRSPMPADSRPRRRKAGALGNLRIGEVLGTGLTVWLVGLPVFLLLTAIPYLPFAALSWWVEAHQPEVAASAWYGVVLTSASMLLALFITAIVIHAVSRRLRGKPVSFADSLEHALGRLPAILGLSLITFLFALAVAAPFIVIAIGDQVGPLVLALPVVMTVGVVIYTGWWVAVPVCVVERLGGMSSIKRSWFLTRGSRFAIFMLVIVFTAFTFVVSLLTQLVLRELPATLAQPVSLLPEFLLVSLQAVVTAVGYHELRLNVEGIGAEDLAAIFD